MSKRLRCYFSFRSPYAWLAMQALEEAGYGIGSELSYVPYFEPQTTVMDQLQVRGGEFLYAPMPSQKHRYILGDVKRQLLSRGITPKWPVDRSPDWSPPHLAFLACPDAAIRRHFWKTLTDQRWLRGEDIWNWPAVETALRQQLASSEVEAVVARAQSEEIREQAVDGLYEAYLDDVFGVPFMIVGREKFWGNDRVAEFMAACRESGSIGEIA